VTAGGPVWTVVLAAGGGTRFGGPKQFCDLGGRPLLEHPVVAASPVSDGVVVVLPEALRSSWAAPAGPVSAQVLVTGGGASRAESVRAGLAAVPADAGVIVITDAAHPLASTDLYARVVGAVRAGADAAVPGLPLTEVVKEVTLQGGDGPLVAGRSLARETHRLVQTPHAFRADLLRAAHAGAAEAVEDSAMVAALGASVVVVPGEPTNIHVTTPEELTMARRLLTTGNDPAGPEGNVDEHGPARVPAAR
jgi:2-C-methyl-D-erythritol 4-phosphate cytidylyltransferase